MPYWIHRNGENVGPYDLSQLQEMLAGGQATVDDLAIEEGASEWSTVGNLAGSAPPPAVEPMMAELVSPVPMQEPALETATKTGPALQAAAAGSSKLKFAIIGLVALLVVGGGVFAFTQFSGDDGDAQKQTQNNPGDTNPGKLPELPSNPNENSNNNSSGLPPDANASNPDNNLPAPLPPPVINPPVNQPGTELVAGPAPKAVEHIPANAVGVFSINLGQLLKKAGGYQALLDKVMQAAGPEANDPMIKAITGLLAPDKLAANFGIGIDEPLLVFTTDDMKVGVLLPVADANKLELAIPNVAVMLEAELPDLQPADGYKYVAFPQQASAVALGPNAMVVLIDTKAVEQGQPKDLTRELDQLMKLPSAGGGQLAQVSPHFSKHAQMPYDGALWLNVKELIKVVGNDMPPEAQEFIGNPEMLGEKFEVAAGISFQQGRIVTEVLMGYDEKLVGDWGSGANLDSGILDVIPGNTIAVLTQSMNMDVIRPFVKARVPGETVEEINAVLTNFGLNWDTLINLPKGDLALSLLGLKGEEPEILFSMNLTDPSKANEVLGKIQASPLYEGMQQSGFDAMIKGNVLHIVPLSLKSSIETGKNGNPLNLEVQKLLAENDSAVYFSLASLTGALPPMDPTAMAMVQQFKDINIIGNAEPSGQRFTSTISMTDPNANVLQTLVDQAFQQAMNMQRQLDDLRGIPTTPDPSAPFNFPPPPGFGDGQKTDEKGEGSTPIPFPPTQGFGVGQREGEGNETNTLPTPSPFPPPPGFGEKSKSSGKDLPLPPSPFPPNRPPFGKSKEKAAPAPSPGPPVPEVNPFNPK